MIMEDHWTQNFQEIQRILPEKLYLYETTTDAADGKIQAKPVLSDNTLLDAAEEFDVVE